MERSRPRLRRIILKLARMLLRRSFGVFARPNLRLHSIQIKRRCSRLPSAGRTTNGTTEKSGKLAIPKLSRPRKKLTIPALLKPHKWSLILGFVAVLGEALANLLEPWPLKIVVDYVFRSHESGGPLIRFVHSYVGADKFAVVKFACFAVLAIAILDA